MIVSTGKIFYSIPASIERGAHSHSLSEPSGRTPPVRLFMGPTTLNNSPLSRVKKVTFDMEQWAKVERRADACNMKTTAFIRDSALNSELYVMDLKQLAPLLNGMRIISNNINQVARKANETNNIYAGDVEKLKGEVGELCHMLSRFLSTPRWTKV